MFETQEKHTYFHAVLPGETLLSAPCFPHLLHKIKAHCGVKDLHYEALYGHLLSDFAAFVQAVPLLPEGKPGTLLVYSVERATKSLEKYHQTNEKDFDIRFAYAVFTAALLQDLGKILGQQRIAICDAEGAVIEDWLPHSAPMPEGAYYRLWFWDNRWFFISKFSAPLLARQIMPASGFNWIAQDLPTYKMWLEALLGEGSEEENKLLKFLAMVDPGDSGGNKRIPSAILKPYQPIATTDGDAFLEWLEEGLLNGKISTNKPDSMVFILPSDEVFLVCPSIFQEFLRQHPGSLEWEHVCKQFARLGVTDNMNNGELSFDKFLIQKEAQQNAAAAVAWGASHFASRSTAATLDRAKSTQVVREGVTVNALVFRQQLSTKGELQQMIRQSTERQERNRVLESLNEFMQMDKIHLITRKGG
ncbi:MAG: hypothetical protein K0Q74_1197 [Gammaproteobacteria bacterium]|nr:hypothetical protein [Gammaproteobacteria bacterium]